MTTSGKSASNRPSTANSQEVAAEALQGTAVGISLTPAVVGSPRQEERARLVCQNDDEASTNLQEKLAQQLIVKLGKAGAIDTCRTNNWDGVLAQVLKASDQDNATD